MAVHDRLKYARKQAGLSGPQIEERSGIGKSVLSELEHGKREPSLSQLSKLASLYRRSVAFFLDPGPIAPEPCVLWKMRPAIDAEQTEIQFRRLCSQYRNLENWCDEKVDTGLPEITGSSDHYSNGDAEELAKRVRHELQLGDRPGQCLLAVLEEVWGVKVFHLKFEPVGTAASVRSEEYGPAILLNANNPRGRRNDDLAHELFHLLTWNVFHPASTNTASSEAEERFAGHFAANLLMPSDPFRSAINSRIRDQKIGFDSLYDVAREFDVSVDSVISRMYDLYNHLPEDNEQVQKDIKRAEEYAHILDRREDSPKPPTYPERYRALAIKAFRHGEMSTGQFAEYLNISRQEAQQFDQEVSDGEEVQVVAA